VTTDTDLKQPTNVTDRWTDCALQNRRATKKLYKGNAWLSWGHNISRLRTVITGSTFAVNTVTVPTFHSHVKGYKRMKDPETDEKRISF